MKKSILILLIGLFSINIGMAQSPNDEIKKGFENLEGEISKMLKDFEVFMNSDALAKLDTLDINSFGIDIEEMEKRFNQLDKENMTSEDMMDLMKAQMEMLDQIDFSKFNQLFKDLGLDSPNIPSPNQKDKMQPKGKETPTKKGKKRKVYKL